MKIFIINPDFGVTPEQMAARCHLLSVHVGPDVELHMECLVENHIEIDSALDAALAAPEIIKMAVRAESEGYDAVVLYCFREVVSIPVGGGGQASCLLAPLVGRQAGLLLADTARYAEKQLFVAQCGVDPARIAAIGGIEARGVDLWAERERVLDLLTEAGKNLLAAGRVQVLLLGCLSFLGLAHPLSERLGVPVVDPAVAPVALAECLVRQELKTSRKAYPAPPLRKRTWQSGQL